MTLLADRCVFGADRHRLSAGKENERLVRLPENDNAEGKEDDGYSNNREKIRSEEISYALFIGWKIKFHQCPIRIYFLPDRFLWIFL